MTLLTSLPASAVARNTKSKHVQSSTVSELWQYGFGSVNPLDLLYLNNKLFKRRLGVENAEDCILLCLVFNCLQNLTMIHVALKSCASEGLRRTIST